MPSTDAPDRLWWAMVAVGLLVVAVAATGIPGRATYGAQVTADEPQYLLSAMSLFEDRDLDITDELAAKRWRAFHEAQLPMQTKPLEDGRHISPHDPLLPLLLALPMGLGGWVGAKAALAVIAGLTAALTLWVAVRRFGVTTGVAAPLVAVFFVSAPLVAYGHQVYPEMAAALAVLIAVAALTGPERAGSAWIAVTAVVALPWLALKYTPVAAVLAAILLVRRYRGGRVRSAALFAAAFAVAGLAFLGAHLVIWNGLTAYASGDHFVGGEFTAVGSAPNYLGRSVRLLGLLIDREFGLAAWQPAWLSVPLAAVALLRWRTPHRFVLLAPLAAGWLTATFVALTMHGYWFPGRQLIVVLPLGVLAVCVAAERVRIVARAVLLVGLIGIWSYGWLTVGVLRRQLTWIVDFMQVGDPWYRAWSWLLPAYRLGGNAVWALHAVWLTVLVAVGVAIWRWRRPDAGSVPLESAT